MGCKKLKRGKFAVIILKNIRGIFAALLCLTLVSGCHVIGIEVIHPSVKQKQHYLFFKGATVATSGNGLSVYGGSLAAKFPMEGKVNNQAELIKVLGEPDVQTETSVRYNTRNMHWWGIVLDCAIFPIPATLPIMVPTGKGGYVEISFQKDGKVSLSEYKTHSNFFGLSGGEVEFTKFYWGNTSGAWFGDDFGNN
jgi:hypothetical protein